MKLHLSLAILLAASICGGQLYSQTVALDEDFSSGVPPTGWTHVNVNGAPSTGWIPSSSGRAWHQDENLGGIDSENRLVSSVFSLAGMSEAYLHFDGEIGWATYLAINGSGNGTSHMQISTNGGATWANVWTETATANGSYDRSVSLAAYVGQASVQLGIYYFGSYAHEWWVDNVVIDDLQVTILDTFTHPTTAHAYFLLGTTDWTTAQTMAQSLGGALVSIGDSAENSWIRAQTSNRDMWIGINDIASEGDFVWVNGEPVTYSNWASGQGGIAPTEDFGMIGGGSGLWYDYGTNHLAHALVEISEPMLTYSGLVGGQITTIACAGLKAGARVVFVFSPNGAGPISTPYGILEVDPDIISPPFFSQNGQFEFSTLIPVSLSGSTLYGQAIAFNNDSSTELSNAMAEPIL